MAKVNDEILANLYSGDNPYKTAQIKWIDQNYPHTNISSTLIEYILSNHQPAFWLELGSFIGNSAIKVAQSAKETNVQTGIICCDPFCGDVNMWDWEAKSVIAGNNGHPYKFLALQDGLPTIYQRFLANVLFSGYANSITPIQATSLVGIKLIERLSIQNRITALPTVIYLDSAHEPDETYLELVSAWRILPSGGILLGDDWCWEAVRTDVTKLSETVTTDDRQLEKARMNLSQSTVEKNILLIEDQWVLFKH